MNHQIGRLVSDRSNSSALEMELPQSSLALWIMIVCIKKNNLRLFYSCIYIYG